MVHFLEQLKQGQTICIKAKMISPSTRYEDHVMLRSMKGWILHVAANFQCISGDGNMFSFYEFVVTEIDGEHALITSTDWSFIMGHKGGPLFTKAVELCCGLGGLSSGAEAAGVQIQAAIDVSPLAVRHFSLNHKAQAIQGDIRSIDHIMHLAESIDRASVGLLMGFPCPPFSVMGDQRGFEDSRAWTFVAGLDCAYLLHSSFVVLECTPLVETHRPVVEFLDAFASVMGFSWASKVLHLERAWPTKRSRWWCVLLPSSMCDHLHLDDLPLNRSLDCVASLLSEWPVWSVAEEERLACVASERAFLERFTHIADHVLDMEGVCPTLLHSLARHDRSCPCGCRAHGLSPARLERDGVSTLLLTSVHLDSLRYPHAKEAGFLCSLSPDFVYEDPRDALPLVGQTAAPIQAHWVLLSLLRAVSISFPDQVSEPDSLGEHRRFVQSLRHLAKHLWVTPSVELPRTMRLQVGDTCVFAFQVPPRMTMDEFITEQQQSGAWDSHLALFCDGLPVPFGAFVLADTYRVVEVGPTVCAALSLRQGSFIITFNGWTWFGQLPSRPLLCKVLRPLGFRPGLDFTLMAEGLRYSLMDSLPLRRPTATRTLPGCWSRCAWRSF